MRLADVIGHWLGKVEIVLAGADDDLRDGEDALAAGDPMRARAAARRVLSRAPDSPIGLALLADACDAAHLDAELTLTLEELARRAPSRAEVWVRLADARRETHAPSDEVRDALVRALAVAEPVSDARRDALLALADLDLAAGFGARAQLWLERVDPSSLVLASPTIGSPQPPSAVARAAPTLPRPSAPIPHDIAVRFAEADLLRGDAKRARTLLESLEDVPTDGRTALARGRAHAMLNDARAFPSLIRALVLDTPGASEALSSALAHIPTDTQTRTRVRSVVDAMGEQHLARWRAAFARAEGAHDAARAALREALAEGETAAARPLLDAAIEDKDAAALDAAIVALAGQPVDEPLITDARRIARAVASPRGSGDAIGVDDALDTIDSVVHPRLVRWAEAVAADVARAWVPSSGRPACWAAIVARLDRSAHALGDRDGAAAVADLAAERSRPVRMAVVGEFNAGKSTFINAIIGADVAPTGVLPTTATVHHLRWAPDPFAKIIFVPGSDPTERIVPLGDLRSTLKTLVPTTAPAPLGGTTPPIAPAAIERVEIRVPLASLVRVEILDTPGFNAPDSRHTAAARSALEEADVAVWLLDATQPVKQSERIVLEEAKRLQLPVQILVNKADRLSPPDLERVMDSVNAALVETELVSWEPPLAFSAKKAVAGKLGDERALDDSRWAAVQARLDDGIVARSDELKERALRRRAAAIVASLIDLARGRVAVERAETERQTVIAHDAAIAAARIDQDAEATAARLAASLGPHGAAWSRDLDLVAIGRDRTAAGRDPALARYRVDRALAALAPPLAMALSALAPDIGLSPAQLLPSARAIIRAAAGSTSPRATPADSIEAMLSTIARAAVATLVDQLFALSVVPPPAPGTTGVLRELDAIAAALR